MSGSYPFIDIAALDAIREGFARGDAQIVLSHDLDRVLWANGAGARLLGFERIDDVIGEPAELPVAARRQIEAAHNRVEAEARTVSVRLGGELTPLKILSITLPDGVSALLISAENASHASAEDIIFGLGDRETHVALLDADCNVLFASPYFASLNIAPATLQDLGVEVADATDRIVKRRIRAGHHSVPGAIARLSDTPVFHLLCIVAQGTDGVKKPDERQANEAETPVPEEARPQTFRFERNAPQVRFIWKTDAQAVFTEISPEFALTVGPHAADIIGRRFSDVATVFGFDTDGNVASLLEQRDTWSGKRLMWPVEGTSLRIPVELAALPVYSRDRVFRGFRGFGLARPEEAVEDSENIGQALAGKLRPAPQAPIQKIVDADPVEEDDVLALTQEVANDDRPDGASVKPHYVAHDSEHIRNLIEACAQEKVAADQQKQIKTVTEEKRPEGGLTETERNAFREIAERLRNQGLAGPRMEMVAVEQTEKSGDQRVVSEIASGTKARRNEATLLDNLPVPVIIHGGDEVYFVNQALLDITGYAAIEDIRRKGGVDTLFNSESNEDAWNDEQRQGMVLRRADGHELPVDAHLHSVVWQGGRALMLSLMPVALASEPVPVKAELAIVPDSEKQALQSHVDELKTILDTATDGVVLISADGRIRSMNHSASALFGYDRSDTEGKTFSMLFAIESQRAAMDYLSGLSGNGVLSVLNDGREVIGREVNGGFIPLFMTIGKLPHDRGFCAVLRDITQWKRTEEELTHARKEAERASGQKTEFLARISHEIRTPLNAIIGFSELMADEKFGSIGNERYRDYLRDINRSGNHVLALVNDLLDISKIEAGGLDMKFEAVSLNDALSEAISLMQPQANRERIIIRSSFQSNLPDIVADARSIKQVALNLLSNAVRFTQPGGQVIVSTSYEMNGDVAMRVRDTGIGMTKSEVEQALKPFRQVHTVRRQKDSAHDWRNEGTGLGLPLTKAMVEANRAQFSIESTPGQGTIVEVLFAPTRVLAN